MSVNLKQVAILGGAFDPVTRGHMQIADLVLDARLGIEEVWIMPCYAHAFDKRMESADHRLAMCEIASASISGVKVCDYEIKKRFVGGTYFLMRELLSEEFVAGTLDLSIVIGLDNANGFIRWIEHERLKNLVRFIVVPRKGYMADQNSAWYLRKPHVYLDSGEKIMEVSSTEARVMLAENKDAEVARLLDPAVIAYIRAHGLYLQG
jgi:nicotinate-nucleotide adenylyltransferase